MSFFRIEVLFIAIMISRLGFGQVNVSLEDTIAHGHTGTGVVFSVFPHHDEDYQDDVNAIKEMAIARYGEQEWRLNVLTGELHGHLGVYALIGSKMGLFAKEILGAKHDEIRIVSNAGTKPPVSCLNDGLQVSTGATLGHGLITISEMEAPYPEADFICNGKTIKIRLKKEIQIEISSLLQQAVIRYNGLTYPYWLYVRELAIRYWLELDRNAIFDTQ
jgi:pyrimidine-specific ribonucleoside hydrolase